MCLIVWLSQFSNCMLCSFRFSMSVVCNNSLLLLWTYSVWSTATAIVQTLVRRVRLFYCTMVRMRPSKAQADCGRCAGGAGLLQGQMRTIALIVHQHPHNGIASIAFVFSRARLCLRPNILRALDLPLLDPLDVVFFHPAHRLPLHVSASLDIVVRCMCKLPCKHAHPY